MYKEPRNMPNETAIGKTATITGVNGRKIEFTVTASDRAGEIGNGTHTRVVVDETKFMAKASER